MKPWFGFFDLTVGVTEYNSARDITIKTSNGRTSAWIAKNLARVAGKYDCHPASIVLDFRTDHRQASRHVFRDLVAKNALTSHVTNTLSHRQPGQAPIAE